MLPDEWLAQEHVNPPNRGASAPSPHPPWKLAYLRFQPIQTKFSHMTFEWISASEIENGHDSSNVTPPNGGFLPPENSDISDFDEI